MVLIFQTMIQVVSIAVQDNTTIKLGCSRVKNADSAYITIKLEGLPNRFAKIVVSANTTMNLPRPPVKNAILEDSTINLPRPNVKFAVRESSMINQVNLWKFLVCHVVQANSMRTKGLFLTTTIQSKIVFLAPVTLIATMQLNFASCVRLEHQHLNMSLPTKPVVCHATVDVINPCLGSPFALIAAMAHTNLKTVPRFVCPATLDCINRKRANQTARPARKTITPTNLNKLHAKRVWARKKRRFPVLPSVSNVRRGNLCPPTKFVHRVH